ncbi:hypothetical protein LHGZ1_1748 [Laribacter hongkongensis]|uniref:Uncharacterized protein n=1 Tax=Laribacter hongkongensis TaxID=168471 RepID=A0A248LJ92_9NEIS|nr:hypothetical protein LHGZ1_1748 [Laribacter hongkongensis]
MVTPFRSIQLIVKKTFIRKNYHNSKAGNPRVKSSRYSSNDSCL